MNGWRARQRIVLLVLCGVLAAGCQINVSSAPPQAARAATAVAAPTGEPVEAATAVPEAVEARATPLPIPATATPVVVRATPSAAAKPAPTPSGRIAAQTPPEHIAAPSIQLDASVQVMNWELIHQGPDLVSQWIVPDSAAGWHANSALPGQIGNTVLSGHHNIRGEVFRRVVELEPGAPVSLTADGREYAYRVESKFIVPERDASAEQQMQNALWIAPTTDDRLTLVTCWPYTSNTHRVIVVAKPAN